MHRALELLLDRPADERTARRRARRPRRGPGRARPPPRLRRPRPHRGGVGAASTPTPSRSSRKYFELEDPRTVRPIGLELKLEADLGRTRLRGIIDRLELDENGEFVVTDYKTGSVPVGALGGQEPERRAHVRAALRADARPAPGARAALLPVEARGDHRHPHRPVDPRRRAPHRRDATTRSPTRAAATTSARSPVACATSARSSRTAPRTAATRSTRSSSAVPARSSSPRCRCRSSPPADHHPHRRRTAAR